MLALVIKHGFDEDGGRLGYRRFGQEGIPQGLKPRSVGSEERAKAKALANPEAQDGNGAGKRKPRMEQAARHR